MRHRMRAFAVLAMLVVLAVPTGAQWSPGGVTGGTKHLGVGFDTLAVPVAKARFTMIDTTITANASVHRIVAFNLHDPNQLGVYNQEGHLVSAYDRFRTADLNNSLWREEQILYPAWGLGVITDGVDSVIVWDGSNWTQNVVFVVDSGNLLSGSVADIAQLDGVLWMARANGALRVADFWGDKGYGWTAVNSVVYNGHLSDRNGGKSYWASGISPVIVNNAVNAVAVTRGPFAGMAGMDQFGRQRAYWDAACATGISSASYDAYGTLSIFDGGIPGATSVNGATALSDGSRLSLLSQTGGIDNVYWLYQVATITGDTWYVDESWGNTNSGSEFLPFTDAAVFSEVAALEGRSSMGNNSPRLMLGTDEGMALLDAKATDNENGSTQIITDVFRSPGMPGTTVIAISGASSKDPTGNHPWTAVGGVTYVSNTDGPGGSYINLDASKEQHLNVPDHADFGAMATFSMGGWFWRDVASGAAELLLNHNESGGLSDEFSLSVNGATEKIELTVFTAGSVQSIGPAIALNTWNRVDATYDGVNQRLYLNGELVDTDAQNGTTANSTQPLGLGMAFSGGASSGFNFDGRLYGWTLSPDIVVTEEWIKDQYQQGVRNIQSPFDGLLPEAAVVRVTAEPISGRFATLGATVASVWDEYAVLLDTFHCTGCGSLTAGDIAIPVVPGCDSVSVVFGGATGMRAITPDVRLVDMSQWEFPTWSENWVGNGPVVADSSGLGHTWKVQDAVDMASNVGLLSVEIRKGHYDDPVNVDTKGMQIRGEGQRTLITNANSTGSPAFYLASGADSARVSDFAVSTATGGVGNNQIAFLVASCDGVTAERVVVEDSDNHAFSITNADGFRAKGCKVLDADVHGFLVNNPAHLEHNIIFSSAASGIATGTSADKCQFLGNWIDGGGDGIFIIAGADDNLVVGNSTDEPVIDRSGSSTLVGNHEW